MSTDLLSALIAVAVFLAPLAAVTQSITVFLLVVWAIRHSKRHHTR